MKTDKNKVKEFIRVDPQVKGVLLKKLRRSTFSFKYYY